MKHKILTLIFIFLLIPLVAKAAEDCSVRGNVVFKADKPSFNQGDTISGKIIVTNNNKIDSTIIYSLRLINEKGLGPWTLTEARTVPPGNSTYNLYQIFRAGIPSDATPGKWYIILSAGIDNCIWTTTEVIGVSSCFDNVLNGEEEGVDCGGPCKACPAKLTTTIQAKEEGKQEAGAIQYIVESLPFQLPKNFFVYLIIIVLLFMIIIGASIIYWKRRARFAKFY